MAAATEDPRPPSHRMEEGRGLARGEASRPLRGEADTEANVRETLPSRATKPREGKRRQMFLVFGFISIAWCAFLLFMMHDVRLAERYELHDNLDYQGADIESRYGVESASDCSQQCEAHAACFAFTYVKSERACWLKAEGYVSKSNPNTISGAINASLAATRRLTVWNASDEVDEMYEEEPAEGDEFDEFDQFGELPRREFADDVVYNQWGDEAGGEGDDGYGAAEITDADVEAFEDSTTLFGDVQLHSNVRLPSECYQLCMDDGRCVAWTLDKYQFICMLRLRLPQAATVRYSVDFISGVISAAELETRHADWALETLNSSASEMAAPYAGSPYEPPRPSVEITSVMDNVDLFGGDLSELRDVDSVEMCVDACVQASECAAWTLSKHTGACYLKSVNVTAAPQNRSAGLISGILGKKTFWGNLTKSADAKVDVNVTNTAASSVVKHEIDAPYQPTPTPGTRTEAAAPETNTTISAAAALKLAAHTEKNSTKS